MAILGHVHFTAATLVALVVAAIGLAVAFGAPLSQDQADAIKHVAEILAGSITVGGAIVAHGKMTSSSGSAGE